MTPRILRRNLVAIVLFLSAWGQPGHASTITDPGVIITLQGGNATLNWNFGISGIVDLEHSPDLTAWTAISQNNTTGAFSHPLGGANKGFYRLKYSMANLGEMITVQGGTLQSTNVLNGFSVSTFEIGKYEMTWGEWQEVRNWALNNGYTDLQEGAGTAANHPVQNVNWFDAVKWANAKSEMEQLQPVYSVSGSVYRTGQFGWDGSGNLQVDALADGYGLPTEAEWEWAASGGVASQSFLYSESNDPDEVAKSIPAKIRTGATRYFLHQVGIECSYIDQTL